MRTLLVCTALAAIAGCGFGPDRNVELGKGLSRWEKAGVASYRYVVTRSCYCGAFGPVTVTVTNRQVTSRTLPNGDPVPAQDAEYYPDIPGLFALVADANNRADAVSATFHPTYGFPESVVIDYIKNAIDDELSVTASNFEVIP